MSAASFFIGKYGITNFGLEFWEKFLPTQAIFDLFTDIVLPDVEKVLKPDAAIYRLARRRFGLAACEAIFIDDIPANIEGEQAQSFAGHMFVNAAELRAELTALGLLV